jgi:hypothetical protein
VLSAFLIIFLYGRDLIKAPATIPRDMGAVVVSAKKGGLRWTANWTMEPIERDGKKAVRFTERGQGHISPFSGEVRWSLEVVWSAQPAFQPLDSEKIVTSAAGEQLLTERKHFDVVKGLVKLERLRPARAAEEESLKISDDTLIAEGIAGVLRYLMFDQAGSFQAHLLSNEPRLYTVTFENRGREHVKTPAGDFDCYKVEMVPHLGVLNVVRYFYPKAFFWFTASNPHFWVRYQGPEGGPGTPEVVMELDHTTSAIRPTPLAPN